MVRKVRLVTVFLIVLTLLLGVSVLVASAAGPTNNTSSATTASTTNVDLQHAMPITGQSMTFPANSVLWFSFQYPGGKPGNKPTATVTLMNGNSGHLAFKVWTPEQAAAMTGEVAIGQGTPRQLNCNIHSCPSTDLVYQGQFYTAGTYFVEVFNNNSFAVNATLMVSGAGVTSTASSQTTTSQPSNQGGAGTPALSNQNGTTNSVQPNQSTSGNSTQSNQNRTSTSTQTANATNIDLQHAMPVGGQQMMIPANSALWFSFNYPGGKTGSKPVVTVTLMNGNLNHLSFKVWTPEQAADMTNQVAIGQGTPTKLNCNIQTCPSTDLVYQGMFLTPGTYFVEVFNNNPFAVNASLMVSGAGVTSTASSSAQSSSTSQTSGNASGQ